MFYAILTYFSRFLSLSSRRGGGEKKIVFTLCNPFYLLNLPIAYLAETMPLRLSVTRRFLLKIIVKRDYVC
jgi:hypothetical protein